MKTTFLSAFCLFISLNLYAQPAETAPGKCFANCYIPDQYQTVSEQIALQPPYYQTTITPPEFTTATKKIAVKEESSRIEPVPATFTTQLEQILVRPATKRYVIVPAEYEISDQPVENPAPAIKLVSTPAQFETVMEKIMVRPPEIRYVPVPAKFEDAETEYETEAAYIRIQLEEPKYETRTERIEIKPATVKWVKRKGDFNCLQADPEDCFVWCLVEEPAEFQEITKRTNLGCDQSGTPGSGCAKEITVPAKTAKMKIKRVAQPASYRIDTLPAVYETIYRQILKTPASVQEVPRPDDPKAQFKILKKPARVITEDVPAEFLTVKKEVIQTPANFREIPIPAEYREVSVKVLKSAQEKRTELIPGDFITVAKRILVREGGFTEWREVLCEEKLTGYTIKEIQSALKARGYYKGPLDNQMGGQTKEALLRFQKENGLPQGQLDFETLHALGIKM